MKRPTTVLGLSLRYGALVAVAVAGVGAVAGAMVDGLPGALSALIGAVLAAAFMGLTAVSIVVADRVSAGRPSSALYFGIIIATWAVKVVVFVVVAFIVRDQLWVNPYLFFGAVLAAVIGSLVADAFALQRARVPYVGDIALPGDSRPENRDESGS